MIKPLLIASLLSIPLIASADSPSHREAAYELLDVARVERMVDSMKAQVGQMMRRQASEPQLNAEQQAVVDKYVLKATDEITRTMEWSRLKEEFATLYASVYTEAELRELTAFYKTPLGQKMLDKMPQLLQETMQLALRHMQESTPQIQKLVDQMMAELKSLRK